MSLVFSAIVPHSPILIPRVGKDHISRLSRTVQALKIISDALAAARPETIIFIANHSPGKQSGFKAVIFNILSCYRLSFEEFGEYGSSCLIPGDPVLAYHLKHRFDTLREKYPIVMSSEETLDSSMAAPIPYLIRKNDTTRLVPLCDRIEDGRPEFEIGQRLRRPIYQEHKRIAMIAVLNLSHRLSEKSPAGYSPKAKAFDQRVLNAIEKNQPLNLMRLREKTISEVKECAIRPLLLMFGIMKDTNYRSQILSYESPFGVGHTVINLRI